MANINVIEKWWTDPRRAALARRLGNSTALADGCALMMWKTGYQYWSDKKQPKQAVPKQCFDLLEHATDLLACALAEVRNDEVYVKGSQDWFAWVFKKAESGKKGGQKRVENEKKRQAQLKHSLSDDQALLKHNSSDAQADIKQCLSKSQANQANYNYKGNSTFNYNSNSNTKKKTHMAILDSETHELESEEPSVATLRCLSDPISVSEKSRAKKQSACRVAYCEPFEDFWKSYVRKDGKGDAYAAYQKLTKQEQAQLPLAISNYVKEKQRQGTEPRFYKHLKTFINDDWREWLKEPSPIQALHPKTQERVTELDKALQSIEAFEKRGRDEQTI